jgi:hypothetical protein
MLFRETVAVYYENRMKHTNTLCVQNAEFSYVKATTGLQRVSKQNVLYKKCDFIIKRILVESKRHKVARKRLVKLGGNVG